MHFKCEINVGLLQKTTDQFLIYKPKCIFYSIYYFFCLTQSAFKTNCAKSILNCRCAYFDHHLGGGGFIQHPENKVHKPLHHGSSFIIFCIDKNIGCKRSDIQTELLNQFLKIKKYAFVNLMLQKIYIYIYKPFTFYRYFKITILKETIDCCTYTTKI